MKRKMKKVVGYLISTVMFFSLFLVTPQGVRAEETQDPTVFSGATLIGNGQWTDQGTKKTYNVYYNDEPYFQAASDEAPAKAPAYIELNQAYNTRMDNAVGALGGIYDPSDAYYYFTLDAPAKVTIYGQCSTAANSYLAIQKMDSVDETFQPTTISLGMVKGTDAVKSMSASLTAGFYLVTLNWGQGRPEKAGSCYSYIKVNADYNMNRETDSVWNETFPNGYNSKTGEYVCTPYKIGKVMNGVTAIGTNESTSRYYTGYYSFTLSEKTQFHLSELVNVKGARVFPKGGESSSEKRLIDNAVILEPDEYILAITAGSESETYSFNSYTSAVPAIAGVDTIAEKGWSVSGETVTIDNLNVNSGDYAEFCIWSGDKENAGYGKGTAILVIKGNCFIKTLVIDCPVEVLCEEGAQLCVGELVVHTDGEADGKLTYVGGTTYNAATKIFEVPCAHKEMSIVGKKAATCTEPGYTGDQTCYACGEGILGQKTEPLGHKWDNGKVTKEPTVLAEGVKTFTCTNPGCKETKTEAIAKLREPRKNEVIKDKTGNKYKVVDPAKKEVTYKAPADKKAKTVTIPDKVEIDGVTYKVTKVDDGAFKGNKTVTTVKVPSTVATIGKDAFNGCSKLKTVSIPKNVTEIGKNAFKGCAALTKITLPSKCTKIGANAFNGCKKMKTITIKSTKLTSKSIASGAFKGLSKSVTIKVPKKQLKAYKKLLKKKGFKGKVKA